jgi:hypothetical protein
VGLKVNSQRDSALLPRVLDAIVTADSSATK